MNYLRNHKLRLLIIFDIRFHFERVKVNIKNLNIEHFFAIVMREQPFLIKFATAKQVEPPPYRGFSENYHTHL